MTPLVGVLALQGDFEAHGKALERAGAQAVEVRTAAALADLDGLVIPGGESTTMLKLLHAENLLEPLADSLRKSGSDIAQLVGTILRSRHFFSEYAYRQRVKSPVEFALGAIWAVTVDRDKIERFPQEVLAAKLDAMGQQLFAPPNVKGWSGGKSWLNTSTILARHNFAQQVASGHLEAGYSSRNFIDSDEEDFNPRRPPPPRNTAPPSDPNMDIAQLVAKEKLKEPTAIVDFLLGLLLQGDVAPKAKAKLVAYLAEEKPDAKEFDNRIRETTHAIMTMPEYQLA